MRNRSEAEVDEESTTVVEPGDDVTVGGEPLSGPDFFFSARAPRRDLFPASLRRSRTRGKHARRARARARARANHPCMGAPLHLVDLDGESETSRIALRRRFEDTGPVDVSAETQESAAG